MRRTIPAVALLALALTGCDDQQEDVANTPTVSPTSTFTPPPPVTATPTPDGLPTDPETGSEAPAPDPAGPESVIPTPSELLDER